MTTYRENALLIEGMDWLFIRIALWDQYQLLAPLLVRPPKKVVFLSPATGHNTGNLPERVDAHLKAPYSSARLSKVWERLSHPKFTARPLDFFFLKTRFRYEVVRYRDLHQVCMWKGRLQIFTRKGEFETRGSLTGFQARLPIPLARVRRGWLVNEAYQP